MATRTPPRLIVRTDGGDGIGVGHLSRGLAVAQRWREVGGEVLVASDDPPRFWRKRFEREGCLLVEPSRAPGDADWWMVDGYHLRGAAAAPDGARVLVVDDHDGAGTAGAGAQLVVDQNLGTDPAFYPAAGAVLDGPRYALLQRTEPVESDRRMPVRRIVLVLGGAPRPEVLAMGHQIETDERLAAFDVEFLTGAGDVPAALADADLAIAAAGTTSWELCRDGIPSVLVPIAPNQRLVAARLAAAGAALEAEPEVAAIIDAVQRIAEDADLRRRLSVAGRTLVDGRGARRVVCRMLAGLLELGDATSADAERILEWNNDPATRAASFSQAPISWHEHKRWLNERLERPDAASFIARGLDGADVGFVRFDLQPDGTTEIGVTVAPAQRGRGIGGPLIAAGCERWSTRRREARIVAQVKRENLASQQAFLDADFDLVSPDREQVLQYAR